MGEPRESIEPRPRHVVRKVLLAVLAVALVIVVAFTAIYYTRIQTMSSITEVTGYDTGYNLYSMDVDYDYDLDAMIAHGFSSDQDFYDAVLAGTYPLLPVHMDATDSGCSAFAVTDTSGDRIVGRNYDFPGDTSAMLVHTTPKNGYASVAFCSLSNIKTDVADANVKSRATCLTAPFICLDGMNEKGVTIAVLALDSAKTAQSTGKPTITTTLAIRLVLDRAASTQEAVNLIAGYDMYATGTHDYHFFVNDASGDSRVIEYDCDSADRHMVVTPTRTITNFYKMYADNVTESSANGAYGHGKGRYGAIETVLDENAGNITADIAWKALEAAAQDGTTSTINSKTQWSIVYDETTLSATVAIRRDFDTKHTYSLTSSGFTS